MRAHAPHPRGFTLIEMVVSLVVTALLVLGAMAVMVQQQRLLQSTSGDRALQETARTALHEIGENLRRAGFGIDPSLAFDFSTYACAAPVQCRDADPTTTRSDELVFYARDPAFKAGLNVAPSATQLVLTGGLQSPLRRGQILQVMCSAGAEWTYVTVAQRVAVNWTPPAVAPATTTVALLPPDASNPFLRGDLLNALGSCYQTNPTNVRVYRVDRFRYYVDTFTDPESTLTRPYLMLDRGLLNDDGSARVEPVAPDVEDLQLEYVFVHPTTGVTRSVGGGAANTTAGTRLTSTPASIDLAATPPALDALNKDPARRTNSPANIRGVRVNVVARSPGVDLTKRGAGSANPLTSGVTTLGIVRTEGPALPEAGNRAFFHDPSRIDDSNFSHHVRIRVDASFQTRNLDSRGPFYDDVAR